jgi:hypothetical protein
METRTVQLNVQTNAATTQDEFKRLHQEIAKAEQEFEDLNNTLGETDAATVAAKQKVTDLRGAYAQLNQTATDLDGTFEQVYGQLQPLTTRMGEAEDRLYELALAGKQATQEYKDLMAATQNYLRTQQQVDLQVDAGSMPMAQKLTTAVGGVAGAFGVAEGAIALFGVESKEMQETLIRLNAVMAIAGGVVAIQQAIPVFTAMGVAAKTALAGIRTGILATGIGALIVGVGLLVAYWSDIKGLVGGVSGEQQKLNKLTAENLKKAEQKVEKLNKQDNILKLQGKSEKQILQYKITELDATIKIAKTNLENQKATAKAQLEASKRNQSILVGIIEFLTAPITLLLVTIDEIGKALGQNFGLLAGYENLLAKMTTVIFDPKQVEKDGAEVVREAEIKLLELQDQQADYKLQIKEIDKQAAEEKKKSEQKNSKESINNVQKTEQQKLDLTRQLEDEKLKALNEGYTKERLQMELNHKRTLEDLEKESKDKQYSKEQYAELIKQKEENLQKDLLELQKKYADLRLQQLTAEEEAQLKATISYREKELEYMADSFITEGEIIRTNFEKQRLANKLNFDKSQADLNAQFDAGTLAREEYDKLTLLNSQKYHDANKVISKKAQEEQDKIDADELQKKKDKAFQIAQFTADSLDLIASIAEQGAGKDEKRQRTAFRIRKASNLAQASIDGTKAVLSAFADTPGGIVFKSIAATIAGGFAALKIAQIAKSKYESPSLGTDTGGGGSGDAAASMTAQFNTIGTSGINQLATLQQQPVQAYVVSGEVTSAQSLDRNRVQNATL